MLEHYKKGQTMSKNELTNQAFKLYFRLKERHAEQSAYRQAFIQPIVDRAFKRYQRRLNSEYQEKRNKAVLPYLAWTD